MTLSEETTMEDADFVVDKLKEIVAYLRSMSPLYEDFIKNSNCSVPSQLRFAMHRNHVFA